MLGAGVQFLSMWKLEVREQVRGGGRGRGGGRRAEGGGGGIKRHLVRVSNLSILLCS